MNDEEEGSSAEQFEALLDKTVVTLKNQFKEVSSCDFRQFEKLVLKVMLQEASGTEFEGQIKETGTKEFPDIVVGGKYGVEVKTTKKTEFKTIGNSIFEQARRPGVESIYLLMATSLDVRWKQYDSAISNIVITHSPRYELDFDTDMSILEKLGTTYDVFRKLSKDEKMQYVSKLHDDKVVWWLSQSQSTNYRFWGDLERDVKENLSCQMMIVSPEIFSNKRTKFKNPFFYALAQGVIIPNTRDLFTAGGSVNLHGKEYPRIVGNLDLWKDEIVKLFQEIDIETLEKFWSDRPLTEMKARWAQWVEMVKRESGIDISEFIDDDWI